MNILNFRSNRNLNAYKISLNIKKFIDSWTNQTYIKNLIKKLSYISKIPTNILSYEIKQILSGNFRFSEGKFTNKLALKSIVYDALIFFSLLTYSMIFSKSNFKKKNFNIIVDDVEQEDQAERFSKILKLSKNSALICKKKVIFKKENSEKFNIVRNDVFKIYNKNFFIGIKFKLFLFFFHILFISIKNNLNLFFIFNKLFYKIIDSETLFSKVNSKVLITDRFYRTSAIKNYIFKRNGGLITSCIQKNICEFSISFFINIDIFFSLGKNYPVLLKKLGCKIKKFVPVGSLFMEAMWHQQKKDLKKVPISDVLIIGLNYANAPERMYIDKAHYEIYYEHIDWLKKISNKYPKLNIILKHHGNCKLDFKEQKILENSTVQTIYKSPSINFSYAFIHKAKQIYSFGSTMILESMSINKPSYFLDPRLKNISFHKSIPKAKKIRIKNYNIFEKLVVSNLKKQKHKKIKSTDSLCLKSDKVSIKIVNFLKKKNYI
tara:strand:- start:4010 stop:5482 length:1473 start_codon:yes stop_codon:yes gene_type:complete